MKVGSVVTKSAVAVAGTVPLIGMANISPAAAQQRSYIAFNFQGYPACPNFRLARDDSAGLNSYASFDPDCNYSNGTIVLKIEYKDSGGTIRTSPQVLQDVRYPISFYVGVDSDILRTCQAAVQTGLPWGPTVLQGDGADTSYVSTCPF